MFSLSPAGRHNLEAICVELERAARHYPPLYHQQLKPWSVKGEVSITERQWAAFIENEGLSDDSWCEWHGPFEDFLGIWFGSPEGIDTFRDLSDSLRVVLRREDFSDVDSYDLPRDFDSSHGLLTTLHQWGLKFQLPLLRCFIDVWNADGGDDDAEGFVRLTQTWGDVGDVQYPLHPIVNFLRDDVFTSSLAAVRALLRPDLVIDTNEPWPLSNPMAIGNKHAAAQENTRTREQANDEPSDNHRILETPTKWCILLAGTDVPITPSNNTGLSRIAGLIENSPNTLTPKELFEYGKRPFTKAGRAMWRTANAKAEHLKHNKFRKQSKDDAEQRRKAEEQYNSISEELERARKNADQAAVSRLQKELAVLVDQFNIGDNGKVQKQRAFRDANEKLQQDAIATTIRHTLKELRDTGHAQIADELKAQVDYVNGLFTPIDGLTCWRVVRLN